MSSRRRAIRCRCGRCTARSRNRIRIRRSSFAQRLLEAGASPNAIQQGGATPLHEAAFRGHADLVRLLLRHGAEPNIPDSEGKRPSDLARENGHEEVAALLAHRRVPRRNASDGDA
ncbi:MAG: hypothetical protein E6J87_05180 [Deltaproteobacteria bacterium]|nr:MAG: hypothetical protein E6J87_05180 [Deltaproteobacteria bacterium]